MINHLESRAQYELRHDHPYLAYKLYMQAYGEALPKATEDATRILNAALEICLDYFPGDAGETVQVCDELLKITDGFDSRALRCRGAVFSLRARSSWDRLERKEAIDYANKAEADLGSAVDLVPFD